MIAQYKSFVSTFAPPVSADVHPAAATGRSPGADLSGGPQRLNRGGRDEDAGLSPFGRNVIRQPHYFREIMTICFKGFLNLKDGTMCKYPSGKGLQGIKQALRLAEAICLQYGAAALIQLG
jgi:hypothetical protein